MFPPWRTEYRVVGHDWYGRPVHVVTFARSLEAARLTTLVTMLVSPEQVQVDDE